MTTKMLSAFLLGLAVLTSVARAADPAADLAPEAGQLLTEFLALNAGPPPAGLSKLERAQRDEAGALQGRTLALEFLEEYPTDPRRWIIVDRLHPASPRFVKEWGLLDEDGQPSNPVVDETAALAWKIRVGALQAELAVATDLPEELRRTRDERAGKNKALHEWLRAMAIEARSGKPAPDFTMQDPAGRELKLSDFRGKVVVLDFWATWCGPCIAAMPHNQEVAEKYKDQGVVLLASCTGDTRVKFEKWVAVNGAHYPDLVWVFDPASKTPEQASSKLYDAGNIPTQFIIDREGRIVDRLIGYREGEVILEAALARAGIKVDPAIVALGEAQFNE